MTNMTICLYHLAIFVVLIRSTNAFSLSIIPRHYQSPSSSSPSLLLSSSTYSTATSFRKRTSSLSFTSLYATQNKYEYALLFDCDGVILETEELHRIAYNAAFQHFHLKINNEPVFWSIDYYDMLQNSIGGGKPKMFYHFRTTMNGQFPTSSIMESIPNTESEQQQLIDTIQDWKTNEFKRIVIEEAKPRPGIIRLMDEALNDPTIAVGVCSASTKEAAIQTLKSTIGIDRINKLNVCILGDDVIKKKPDPLIYNTAAAKLNMNSAQCVVIEDSVVGLKAAVAANMKCIITYTSSTVDRDFYSEGAVAVIPDLESTNVTLNHIFNPIRQYGMEHAEFLVGIKDPIIKQPSNV